MILEYIKAKLRMIGTQFTKFFSFFQNKKTQPKFETINHKIKATRAIDKVLAEEKKVEPVSIDIEERRESLSQSTEKAEAIVQEQISEREKGLDRVEEVPQVQNAKEVIEAQREAVDQSADKTEILEEKQEEGAVVEASEEKQAESAEIEASEEQEEESTEVESSEEKKEESTEVESSEEKEEALLVIDQRGNNIPLVENIEGEKRPKGLLELTIDEQKQLVEDTKNLAGGPVVEDDSTDCPSNDKPTTAEKEEELPIVQIGQNIDNQVTNIDKAIQMKRVMPVRRNQAHIIDNGKMMQQAYRQSYNQIYRQINNIERPIEVRVPLARQMAVQQASNLTKDSLSGLMKPTRNTMTNKQPRISNKQPRISNSAVSASAENSNIDKAIQVKQVMPVRRNQAHIIDKGKMMQQVYRQSYNQIYRQINNIERPINIKVPVEVPAIQALSDKKGLALQQVSNMIRGSLNSLMKHTRNTVTNERPRISNSALSVSAENATRVIKTEKTIHNSKALVIRVSAENATRVIKTEKTIHNSKALVIRSNQRTTLGRELGTCSKQKAPGIQGQQFGTNFLAGRYKGTYGLPRTAPIVPNVATTNLLRGAVRFAAFAAR
jgi:hypothetical protein